MLAVNAEPHDTTRIEADTSMLHLNSPAPLMRPGLFNWITNIPGDWWRFSKQTFTVKQLPLIGGLTALTAITIITDYDTWQAFKKPYDENKTYRQINDVTSYLGDGKIQFGIAAAFALYGFGFNDTRAIRTASQTAEVILACGGVVQLLKHLTGRESPFTATTPTGRWDFFPNQIEYAKHVPHFDAFPSGHIATAMATLQVIIENYPEKAWIKYVGYPIIGSIAVGLVSTSIHWWSDIPLGVVLGYTFGRLVAHPESDLAPAQSANEFRPELNFSVLGNGSPAMGFSLRW
ncbi:MAG: phosphatase PAP2 family protein [Bacteroidota bacterium]|nr:phosphatase PAP2 family protein [Bacteroidota bacterium]MDP4237556.1 phosphatase PAP2 family protein [Bacteroidota bacterium]